MRHPADITPLTFLDYPKKAACIFWYTGCNLRCPYCYNPELVLSHGGGQDEMAFLRERAGFLDAVVLSGYGTGGIPEGEYYGFYDVIERWQQKGKTLVITTQVQQEGSDMDVYQVGRGWKNRFDLLESYSMTYESIITKLMWILAQTKEDNQVRKLFYKTVNYDLIG